MENIIPSATRTTAIGKYLVALSLSFANTADRDEQKSTRGAAPSGRRRQLHVLYLLNDLLHHTKYHLQSPSASSMLTENIQAFLVDLFGAVSAYSLEVYVKHHECIIDLLDVWDTQGYFQSSYIRELKTTTTNASKAGHTHTNEDIKLLGETSGEEKKDAPYVLPSSHGDPLTPYYDLPAGNMMPHITPNSARAINPHLVKALQFTAGPADEKLVVAVKDFLKNVESLDAPGLEDRGSDMDFDDLGQSFLGDEIAGSILEGEGYYGWSRAFCKKMTNKGLDFGDVEKIIGLPGSSDGSWSPRKRRRYSDSGTSRSRDRTMDKSRSSSSSSNQVSKHSNGQRSSSRPRNSSREQRRYRSLRSRSMSYSPPQTVPFFRRPSPSAHAQPIRQAQIQGLSSSPSISFPHPFSKGFPLGPGGIPIPPPPPPNYHGPWPPPPPPIPNSNGHTAPALAPPTGPKIGQTQGAPGLQRTTHSGTPSQTPQNFGGRGQQQFGHVSVYPYGDRGSTQQPLDANPRGRGYGRGGWTR